MSRKQDTIYKILEIFLQWCETNNYVISKHREAYGISSIQNRKLLGEHFKEFYKLYEGVDLFERSYNTCDCKYVPEEIVEFFKRDAEDKISGIYASRRNG